MTELVLPNVRKIFIPDPGYVMFEADLRGADAQVVAWEAEDEDLMAAFRAGLDVHVKNAEDMFGSAFTKLIGAAWEKKRKQCKQAVHLTNYGGTARALAMVLGWLTHEADQFQKRWFTIHPKIKTNFHKKIENELQQTRTIKNIYGFQRVYFDRIDACFTEALAWKPQSTVAITTYLGAFKLEEQCPWVEILLQTHDSLTFQVPHKYATDYARIRNSLRVLTPYTNPLYIPWELSASTKSWGDCQKIPDNIQSGA